MLHFAKLLRPTSDLCNFKTEGFWLTKVVTLLLIRIKCFAFLTMVLVSQGEREVTACDLLGVGGDRYTAHTTTTTTPLSLHVVAVDCRRLHVSCYHLTILVRTSRQMSSSQLVMWVPIRSRLANSVLTSLTNMLTDMWATLTDTIIDIFCSSPSLNSVLHSLLQLVTSNITILMWLLLLLITLLYWCEFCY